MSSFQTLLSSEPEQVAAIASKHHLKDRAVAAVARFLDALGASSMPALPSSFEASALVPEVTPLRDGDHGEAPRDGVKGEALRAVSTPFATPGVHPTAPSSNPDSGPVCDGSTDADDYESQCFGWSGLMAARTARH